MLTDDAPRILTALRTACPAAEVTTAWPREPPAAPTILVTLAGDSPADWRDDRRYFTELEYLVRVFAAKAADMRAVCGEVHEAMEALGYTLAFRYEEPGDGWRQTALRYKIYM